MSLTCRPGCGACCIAPSISAPMPGLPDGKPAGVRCPHLSAELRCNLWGHPERPAVCSGLRPEPAMCGADRDQAMATIEGWERLTAPPTRRAI
jgi:hypothetical protein